MTDSTSARPAAGPVCFVGAGPGDPDLLTVRALSRLRDADLILRDILVPDSVLEASRTRACIVDVGRLCGGSESQEARLARIAELMTGGYFAGKRVVRLKSGDPLIFGRTVEEIRVLDEAGVPHELVPGITAGFAAASLAGIPLTERSVAPSVLICTGQTAGGGLDRLEAWASLLRGGTTLVLYMGLKALSLIAPRLREEVCADEIHVVAISRVGMPGQRWVHAPLCAIEAVLATQAIPLPTPVVIIMGQGARPFSERFAQGAATLETFHLHHSHHSLHD